MTDKTLYNEDSIQSLSDIEHIKLRPSMFLGNVSTPYGIVKEILDNSLDEVGVGHCNKIIINIDDDGVVEITDNGQGILANVMKDSGMTILQESYGLTKSSGKFSDDGVYAGRSKGLHGYGAALTTYLSDWLTVTTKNGGQYETIYFKEGYFEKRESGKTKETGVSTRFLPGAKYFTNDKINLKELEEYLDELCGIMPQLTIIFNSKEISHPEGLEYLINRETSNEITICDTPLIFHKAENNRDLHVAMTYTGNSKSTIIGFANFGITKSGSHYTAIKSTLTRIINKWARDCGLLKEKDKNLDGSSLQEGLVLIFNIVSAGIEYDSNAKDEVISSDFVPFINKIFGEQLELWLDNNPEDGKNIIEKALLARKASEAARKAREAVKNKVTKKEKVFKLPTTLTDCWTKDRAIAELLVCEGKSAASGLVAARSAETQAVYGVRGKMLSVLKTTPAKILANQEINNLIQALGLECDQKTAKLKYDKNKLRYNKIIACADADQQHSPLIE